MREHDLSTGPRGLNLRICSWGPTTGRPVLILHGFLEQGAAWHTVAEHLVAAGRRVIAPDHRGHGLSDHVGPGGFYHFFDYVADVDALVRHLGEPVDLVGHSMGGTIATLYAAMRPHTVRSLVLVEGLGPPDMSLSVVERAATFLDHRADPPTHTCFPHVGAAIVRMRRFNPSLPDHVAERLATRITRPVRPHDPHVKHPQPGWITWTWDALHRARSPVPFRTDQHVRFLGRITCPTLLADGGVSPFKLDDAEARIMALRDVRRYLCESAGHLVHHDATEELADAILDHTGA